MTNISKIATDEQLFNAFWQAFPKGRKNGKIAVRELFVSIIHGKNKRLSASAEVLIRAALRYKSSVGDNYKYVVMPLTWLKQGRWEDEDIVPSSIGSVSTSFDKLIDHLNNSTSS